MNDPKKYPENSFLSASSVAEPAVMTDEEMERQGRRNTIRMGGKINK